MGLLCRPTKDYRSLLIVQYRCFIENFILKLGKRDNLDPFEWQKNKY